MKLSPDVVVTFLKATSTAVVEVLSTDERAKRMFEKAAKSTLKGKKGNRYEFDPEHLELVKEIVQRAYRNVAIAKEAMATKGVSGQLDPYRILGVTPDAPIEVITAAWKALAMKHHPDRGGDPRLMQVVNAAYEAIKNAQKK